MKHLLADFLLGLCLLCLLAGQALPAQAVQPDQDGGLKILPLGSPCVEIIFALGLGDQVVGRASWDVWPPQLLKLPDVGDPSQPNLELILTLQPDLIVADVNYSPMFSRLERYGFKILTVSAYNTHEIVPAVRYLAGELGAEPRGAALADHLQGILDLIAERTAHISENQRPSALFLTGDSNAYYTFSDKSGWSMFELAGLRNMAAGLDIAFPSVSREWLAVHGPDFVIVSPMSTLVDLSDTYATLGKIWNDIRAAGPLAGLDCVKNGNFAVMEDLLTFGLRSVFGSLFTACRVYPDLFADVDPQAMLGDFLGTYFALVDEQIHIYP